MLLLLLELIICTKIMMRLIKLLATATATATAAKFKSMEDIILLSITITTISISIPRTLTYQTSIEWRRGPHPT